jgi:hypothetical protein
MSLKSNKVKSGYSELDYLEREEVKKYIRDFDEGTFELKKLFSENLRTVVNKSGTQKSESGCPCCGK